LLRGIRKIYVVVIIRDLIMDGLEEKEKEGWTVLTEKSLNKLWDNKKDDGVWSKYGCNQ
jgi:hypothetical protein